MLMKYTHSHLTWQRSKRLHLNLGTLHAKHFPVHQFLFSLPQLIATKDNLQRPVFI